MGRGCDWWTSIRLRRYKKSVCPVCGGTPNDHIFNSTRKMIERFNFTKLCSTKGDIEENRRALIDLIRTSPKFSNEKCSKIINILNKD